MKKLFLITICFFLSFMTIAQVDSSSKIKEIGITTTSFNSFGFTYRIGKPTAVWRINAIFGKYNNNNNHQNNEEKVHEYIDSLDIIINEEPITNTENSYDNDSRSFDYGISVGREFRKKITNKLDLRYGFGVNFGHSYSSYERGVNMDFDYNTDYYSVNIRSEKVNNYRFGGDIILGVNYNVMDNFFIGAEVIPGIQYVKSKSEGKYTDIRYDVLSDNIIDTKESERNETNNSSQWNADLSSSSVLLSFIYQF